MILADVMALVDAHLESGTAYRDLVYDLRITGEMSLPRGHRLAANHILHHIRNNGPLKVQALKLYRETVMLRNWANEQGIKLCT